MRLFWSRVEAKVKAAAIGTLVISLVLALLNAVVGNSQILGGFPAWLQFVLITCAPTLVAFLSGYNAKHTAIPPVPPVKP
jgi:hypothetical protein